MMQQEQKCVAKARLNPVSDSLFKNQSLINRNSEWDRDYSKAGDLIFMPNVGENVSVSQSFSYNDLNL